MRARVSGDICASQRVDGSAEVWVSGTLKVRVRVTIRVRVCVRDGMVAMDVFWYLHGSAKGARTVERETRP